jgi:hypothetical protein
MEAVATIAVALWAAVRADFAGGSLARNVSAPIGCAEVRPLHVKAGLPDETLFPFKCVNQTAYGATSFLRVVITIQI